VRWELLALQKRGRILTGRCPAPTGCHRPPSPVASFSHCAAHSALAASASSCCPERDFKPRQGRTRARPTRA
jgi:hypothetical protein